MRVPLFAIRAQNQSLRQGLEQGILSVLQQDLFIDGPHVASFEQAFAEACGCKYCVGVGNGTDGLYLALKALGIGSGDEVITTAYSFVATAQAITRTGAEVRFVDIERATCNLDPALIEPLITPRTRAILPVHLFGRPADMAALHHLARRYGLHLVEDAAQAHGAMDHGKPVGSLGNLACFSFYPTKNLGAIGDGGAVVTDNASLGERVRHLSRQARLPDSDYGRDGINSRLDAVQAAVLSVKLTHLAEWTERRQQIADRYRHPGDCVATLLASWGQRIRCLHNGANKGFAWGNNRGMAQAVGKFVCLLNPDTIIYPGAFRTLIEFMEQHPQAGFAGPEVLNRDGSFQLSAKRSIPTPLDAIYRAVGLSRLFPNSRRFARYNVTYLHPDETQAVDACTGCCIVARQEMLDQIGLLDEGYFIYCEDVDWFVRAKKAHWEVWYVAAAVIEHHHAYSAAFRKRQAVVDFHHSMTRFYRKHLAADYPENLAIYC